MSRFTKAVKLLLEAAQKEVDLINSGLPIPRWSLQTSIQDGKQVSELVANYKLKSFHDTWGYLNRAAALAALSHHHPTITTTYNKVRFAITTHDVGNQVTNKDINLAQKLENCFLEHHAAKGRIPQINEKTGSNSATGIISDLTRRS